MVRGYVFPLFKHFVRLFSYHNNGVTVDKDLHFEIYLKNVMLRGLKHCYDVIQFIISQSNVLCSISITSSN